MDLDPRYLQTFFEVSRARSFSRAAAVLHKTQPAVSYQIGQLEQQLGAILFDRTTRQLTLTRAGTRLFDVCDRFFGEFARLAAGLADPSAEPFEPVRIAAVSGFGRYVLYPILERMPAPQPYSLRFPTAEQVFRSVEDGSCDLGFVYLPLVSSRLLTTAIYSEELVLVGPAKQGLRRLPRTLEAFAHLSWVTYDECEYVFGKWFEVLFGRQPASLQSVYHFEELEEVVATVAAGRGVSIVPDHCAAHMEARGRVVRLRHARRRVRNLIYAVTRAGAPEHRGAARILEALRARHAHRPNASQAPRMLRR
jgi:LysR family transcriptional regulator, cyn operon transcriptional activator